MTVANHLRQIAADLRQQADAIDRTVDAIEAGEIGTIAEPVREQVPDAATFVFTFKQAAAVSGDTIDALRDARDAGQIEAIEFLTPRGKRVAFHRADLECRRAWNDALGRKENPEGPRSSPPAPASRETNPRLSSRQKEDSR